MVVDPGDIGAGRIERPDRRIMIIHQPILWAFAANGLPVMRSSSGWA
jgi:hypothetical protein